MRGAPCPTVTGVERSRDAGRTGRDPLRVLLAVTLVVAPACFGLALAGPLALAFFVAGSGSALAAYGALKEEPERSHDRLEPLPQQPGVLR